MVFLVAAAFGLSACSESTFFNMPQKVTIEKKEPESSSVSASSESDANAESSSGTSTTPTPGASTEPAALVPVGVVPADPSALNAAQQKDAVDPANERLDHGFYSRESLIAALISDGFTEEQAIYGADHCYVTWGVPDEYDMPADAAGSDNDNTYSGDDNEG